MAPVSTRFDVSLMPEGIQRRTLEPYSVHYNTMTRHWVATISRHERTEPTGITQSRTMCFKFASEIEAKKFAKAYSPPKMHPFTETCQICAVRYTPKCRPCSCRNCGVCICDKCSTRWAIRMLPKTYVSQQSLTARVCTRCDWLSNSFCITLLKGGSILDAKTLFASGNVNLRSCFADINHEAMFPVHCAVKGGNLQLLQWLVETHECPISVKRNPRTGRNLSLRTSCDNTLIDFAMTGKPKIDILRYLVVKHNMSLKDATNPNLATSTLEALLRCGASTTRDASEVNAELPAIVESFAEESVATIDDACNLCFEHPMDCVMTPCGHQLCCFGCGSKLTRCPLCNVECNTLKIFRQ